VAGGRYSDWVFNKLKAQNGGKGEPEVRSFVFASPIAPL
jgi:hypothetical protein